MGSIWLFNSLSLAINGIRYQESIKINWRVNIMKVDEYFNKKIDEICISCIDLIHEASKDNLSEENMRDFINSLAKYRQLMINKYGLK